MDIEPHDTILLGAGGAVTSTVYMLDGVVQGVPRVGVPGWWDQGSTRTGVSGPGLVDPATRFSLRVR